MCVGFFLSKQETAYDMRISDWSADVCASDLCHTDRLAAELGMDPAEFRLKNLMSEGEDDQIGTTMEHIKAREVLEGALNAADWHSPKPANVGRGIALFEIGRA